ncbi:unnamed protein product [Cuscuta epithymum]|uniref:Rab-GAP TBC domain-containing protein n=1 Tax=Cuscuta epithymum TaxID=186058 RepID=A0AAV0EPJ4_9ASTE|nr:unnamed protein product [Cuscuta epithymum]
MVLGGLAVTENESGREIIFEQRYHRSPVVTVATLLFSSLMFDFFSDGRQVIFAEASGSGGSPGGGGGLGGAGLHWVSVGATSPSNVGIAVAVTAMAGIALAATLVYSRRGNLKSPWSQRRRKHALSAKEWKNLFDADGRLSDGGVKFLKKVRSGGVDPTIRAEVWPFLLGVYDLKSSMEEREAIRTRKRKQYGNLRRKCLQMSTNGDDNTLKLKESSRNNNQSDNSSQVLNPLPHECENPKSKDPTTTASSPVLGESDESSITTANISADEHPSTNSDSSDEPDEEQQPFLCRKDLEETNTESTALTKPEGSFNKTEDFATWQRIIRVDAVRANDEWVSHSPTQAAVSEIKANQLAESVALKDYDHLGPCRTYHAARLVSILEAYALYDPEIGYCQGMSDLLSPIISVIEKDDEAFWCFVGFMRKARHNFRLDEVGIRRQLSIVSKIIKCKDSHLYRHLEQLQAEDCFFVYRMVVVLFRRELSFEQSLCLWEVMWADQAAIRAGIGKSAWGRMRLRAPPSEDLLLYAIAASVLQKRKLIIEKYSSMDEIMRECNSMAGNLDVWRLLDDAHDLVVTLHNKI